MPQTAPTCSNATLKTQPVCYVAPQPLSPAQQKALLVYGKVLELAAIGGTDYSEALTTTLITDAASATCGMDQPQRDAARVNLEFINAAAAGATVPETLAEKVAAIRCLELMDPEQLDSIDLLLTCQLGVHDAYFD